MPMFFLLTLRKGLLERKILRLLKKNKKNHHPLEKDLALRWDVVLVQRKRKKKIKNKLKISLKQRDWFKDECIYH